MKKLVTNILVLLFTLTMLIPIRPVKAATTNIATGTSTISITDWVIDTNSNTIAAITNLEKKLVFFNATTLKQESYIPLPGIPTDIIQDGDKIYIALDTINQILEFDLRTRTKTKTFYTQSDPYSLVKNGNIIYYTEMDDFSSIFAFDITTNKDNKLNLDLISEPSLAINKDKNILYIGESCFSSSNLFYYSLTENKVISTDIINEGNGISYPQRKVVFDGNKVIYANKAFNPTDATKIYGEYELVYQDEKVIDYFNDILITNTSFYNNNNFVKLGKGIDTISLAEVKDNLLYTYNDSTKTITRYNNLTEINSSNIIDLVKGTPCNKLETDTLGNKLSHEVTRLDLNSTLYNFIVDTDKSNIYAIANYNRGLFFINENTLNIKKSINLPSNPTDIIQDGDKIYVALSYINQIQEYDLYTFEKTATFYTQSHPQTIVKSGNRIFFTSSYKHSYIYEYDIEKNTESQLNIDSVYSPSLAMNKDKTILYIGESESSGSNLYYYSLLENKIISKSNYDKGYGFPFPGKKIVTDNDSVYYAGRRFNSLDATRILGEYDGNSTIIGVGNDYVYTSQKIYNKETYDVHHTFNSSVDIIHSSKSDVLYSYSLNKNSLLRISPDVTAPIVEGVKNDGVYINPVTVTFDEGTATLNGNPFTNGGTVSEIGDYVLEVIDEASNKTTIKFTIKVPDKEDINKDGIVNALDLSLVATNYNMLSSDVNWNPALDLNNDSIIDIYDLTQVSKKL